MVGYETTEELLKRADELFDSLIEFQYFCLDCYNYKNVDILARKLQAIAAEASNKLLNSRHEIKGMNPIQTDIFSNLNLNEANDGSSTT